MINLRVTPSEFRDIMNANGQAFCASHRERYWISDDRFAAAVYAQFLRLLAIYSGYTLGVHRYE